MPRIFRPEKSYEKTVNKISNHVDLALNNLANSISILVGIEKPTLDEAIKSGNALAVTAVLYNGNYQITENSLNLALDTHDPDIVKSLIELKDIQINADHVINSLKHLDGNVYDDIEKRTEVAKSLVMALRAKEQYLKEENSESKILKAMIEKDNYPAIKLLASLNFNISQEHIEFANNVRHLDDSVISVLKETIERQQKRAKKQESINSFRLMGEGSRSPSAFFAESTKIPPEVLFKIADMAENPEQPLNDEAKQRIFYKQFS